MVSWQAFPSLLPRAPLAFLSRPKLPFLKLPFPSLSNASHAGYHIVLIKTCTLFIQVIDLLNQAQLEKENKLNCLKQV